MFYKSGKEGMIYVDHTSINMKSNIITALKIMAIVVVLTIINCGLLVASFLLPTSSMRQHFAESYPLIESEHQYLQWDQGYTSSMLDFWSEYTLYGIAINEDAEGTAFDKAMFMWYIDTPGLDRDQAVLTYARYPEEYFELTAYPRYWNGVVIFMKLLLMVFTISDIRMLSMFIHFALFAATVILMYKNNLKTEIIFLTTAILFINPITMIYSVIFSSEYIPMLLCIMAILFFGDKIAKKKGGWEMLFALTAAITSFFCFNSTPYIAWAIPMVVYIWYTGEVNVVKKTISASFYWCGSYALTWAMKWIICTLFTPFNLIKQVIERVDIYENNDNPDNPGVTLTERIMHNLWAYKTPAFIILFIVVVLFIVLIALRDKKTEILHVSTESNMIDIIVGYSLIAFIPFALYIALGNGYSYNHAFMTHRLLAITVLAVLCIIHRVTCYCLSRTGNKKIG